MADISSRRLRIRRGRGVPGNCDHIEMLRAVEPSSQGCEECLVLGDRWVHLRMCMTCGKVGCCNSSKNKHAAAHAQGDDHPIFRSIEPGEEWMWCVPDEVYLVPEPERS